VRSAWWSRAKDGLLFLEKLYLGLVSKPDLILAVSVCGLVLASVAGFTLYFQFKPVFWEDFVDAAAVFGVVGIFLGLPALAYAGRAEERLKRISAGVDVVMRTVTTSKSVVAAGAADEIASQVPNSQSPCNPKLVLELFAQASIYALGYPAGEVNEGHGTEADLLHFEVEAGSVLLPVFSNSDDMRNALVQNPDWQTTNVLEIAGGALLASRDPGVTIVINPWSSSEFLVPPEGDTNGSPLTCGEQASAETNLRRPRL
jgi:hypothetical protein